MFTNLSRFAVLGAVAAALTTVVVGGGGCETSGGNEGDRCNPLVLQDECHSGLHCKPASCSEAYCCPTDRSTTDPHCNAEGCPDETEDAGEDGATGADGDATSDGANSVDSGSTDDGGVDAADTSPVDAGDSG